MLDVVKCVAVMCAPAMAVVARVIDSADDRHDRAHLPEHYRLLSQMQDRPH
jgi:hypothetical protein